MIGKLATAAAIGLLTVGGLAVAQEVVPRTGDTGRCGATGDSGKFAGGTAGASRSEVMRGECGEVIEPVAVTEQPMPVAQAEPSWNEPVTTGASAPEPQPVVQPVDATATSYERAGERG